jgi:hypothetical protein
MPKITTNSSFGSPVNCRPLLAFAAALASTGCWAAEAGDAVPAAEERAIAPAVMPESAPSLQMSTDYAHPALGFGTYMPMGQVESHAIRFEPVNVRAAVQAGMGYDNNVALSSTNKIGSFFSTLAPAVMAGLEGATQRYYAVYRGNYGIYSSNAQDNFADHNMALIAMNSWTARFGTRLSYDYLRSHTPRGISTTVTGAGDRWSNHAARATASYGADGAQGRVEGEIGYDSRRYETGVFGNAGDYDRVLAGGSFAYRIAPKTRAVMQVNWADITHRGDPTLDNTEMRYAVGLTWQALAATTGTVRVGYITKDFSTPTRPDFSGPSFDVSVRWAPRLQSTIDATASRFLSETYEIGSSFNVNTVASVLWTHDWPRSLRTTVNYTRGQVRQEGLGRTDTYTTAAVRGSYALRRSLRLGAELRYDQRESDLVNVDYKRNIMLLTLEAAL